MVQALIHNTIFSWNKNGVHERGPEVNFLYPNYIFWIGFFYVKEQIFQVFVCLASFLQLDVGFSCYYKRDYVILFSLVFSVYVRVKERVENNKKITTSCIYLLFFFYEVFNWLVV